MADALPTPTTIPAPPTPTEPGNAQQSADDGKGGKAAVLADLATERDKRQQLEAQVAALQKAQATQTDALAKAFGLKPEETSDVSQLAASVTALQEQFAATQRQNVVLTVATEHGISDPDDLALLNDAKDEDAIRRLAARIAKGDGSTTTPNKPKPDLTQGRNAGPAPTTPADEFAAFLRQQIG